MAKLVILQTVLSMNGQVAEDSFGNGFICEVPDSFDGEAKLAALKRFVPIYGKMFVESVNIHSLRFSAVPTPGTVLKKKILPVTHWVGEKGAQKLPAGKNVGPLSVCAHYKKLSTDGRTGGIYLRGTINQLEVLTDPEGRYLKPIGDDLVRYQAFEKALEDFFKSLGGRGLVMLPGKFDENGAYLQPAAYASAARPVGKIEFTNLVERDTNKTVTDVDGTKVKTLRKEVNALAAKALKFERESENGQIIGEDLNTLKEAGHNIFVGYLPHVRNKVTAPKEIRQYIK